MKKISLVFILLFSILILKCTTEFIYKYPTRKEPGNSGKSVKIFKIIDKRYTSKKIDKIFETELLSELNEVIKSEFESFGIFSKVEFINDKSKTNKDTSKTSYLLKPVLSKYEWFVPDYNSILTKLTCISILTGGVGGCIYGMTSTDVHGRVGMRFELINSENNKILSKYYFADFSRNMDKFSCDTAKTKAWVTGSALRKIMKKLKRDLRRIFKQ